MTSSQIIEKIPLEEVWDEDGKIGELSRGKYLDGPGVKKLLRSSPVRFVIARIGQPLKFFPEEECYTIWNQEIRDHLMDPPKGHVFLPDQPDGYGYLASIWEDERKHEFIVLLEDYG